MPKSAKISWWAPYWFHMSRTWRTWRLLLRPRLLLRVSLVSALVGTGLIIWLKMALPMIQLPAWWKLLLVLPATYAYFLLMIVVYAAIPSRVQIRKDRIHIMTGQSQWVVKSDAIKGTRIVVFAPDRIRLRIFYQERDKNKTRTLGVGRRVDLQRLSDVLPVSPQVWDARTRYGRA